MCPGGGGIALEPWALRTTPRRLSLFTAPLRAGMGTDYFCWRPRRTTGNDRADIRTTSGLRQGLSRRGIPDLDYRNTRLRER